MYFHAIQFFKITQLLLGKNLISVAKCSLFKYNSKSRGESGIQCKHFTWTTGLFIDYLPKQNQDFKRMYLFRRINETVKEVKVVLFEVPGVSA